jgi:hypothetical protein
MSFSDLLSRGSQETDISSQIAPARSRYFQPSVFVELPHPDACLHEDSGRNLLFCQGVVHKTST